MPDQQNYLCKQNLLRTYGDGDHSSGINTRNNKSDRHGRLSKTQILLYHLFYCPSITYECLLMAFFLSHLLVLCSLILLDSFLFASTFSPYLIFCSLLWYSNVEIHSLLKTLLWFFLILHFVSSSSLLLLLLLLFCHSRKVNLLVNLFFPFLIVLILSSAFSCLFVCFSPFSNSFLERYLSIFQ